MDRKQAAADFLQHCASGNPGEGYRKYASQRFRHHNAHFPGDAESLMKGMEANARQFPDKALDIKHVMQDGDLVAVHSHVRHTPEEPGFALVHIFRFEGDRIAELWDIAQEVPKDSPNRHGMF